MAALVDSTAVRWVGYGSIGRVGLVIGSRRMAMVVTAAVVMAAMVGPPSIITATLSSYPIWDTGHMRIWGHLTPFCVHFKPFWASGTPILGSWGTPILGYPPSTDPRPAGRGSIFAIFLTPLNRGF